MIEEHELIEIEHLLNMKTASFVELFSMTKMDPQKDCKFADLRNSNFLKQDLRMFDFTGSDLTGSKINSALFSISTYTNSLMIRFSEPRLMSLVSKNSGARYLAQTACLSPDYFDRVASIGFFYILFDYHQYEFLSNFIKKRDRSKYVHILLEKIKSISESKDDKNTKYIQIALSTRVNSYPYARMRLKNSIENRISMFPRTSSFFSRT